MVLPRTSFVLQQKIFSAIEPPGGLCLGSVSWAEQQWRRDETRICNVFQNPKPDPKASDSLCFPPKGRISLFTRASPVAGESSGRGNANSLIFAALSEEIVASIMCFQSRLQVCGCGRFATNVVRNYMVRDARNEFLHAVRGACRQKITTCQNIGKHGLFGILAFCYFSYVPRFF